MKAPAKLIIKKSPQGPRLENLKTPVLHRRGSPIARLVSKNFPGSYAVKHFRSPFTCFEVASICAWDPLGQIPHGHSRLLSPLCDDRACTYAFLVRSLV